MDEPRRTLQSPLCHLHQPGRVGHQAQFYRNDHGHNDTDQAPLSPTLVNQLSEYSTRTMVKLRSKAEADSSGTPSKSAATFLGENMPTPPSPSPKPILGSHRDQIASLHISDDNETLYSGDITGLVASTATRTLRALVAWKTHVNAILAVKEWEGVDQYIIS